MIPISRAEKEKERQTDESKQQAKKSNELGGGRLHEKRDNTGAGTLFNSYLLLSPSPFFLHQYIHLPNADGHVREQ